MCHHFWSIMESMLSLSKSDAYYTMFNNTDGSICLHDMRVHIMYFPCHSFRDIRVLFYIHLQSKFTLFFHPVTSIFNSGTRVKNIWVWVEIDLFLLFLFLLFLVCCIDIRWKDRVINN